MHKFMAWKGGRGWEQRRWFRGLGRLGKDKGWRLERGCHRAMGDGFNNMVLEGLSHLQNRVQGHRKMYHISKSSGPHLSLFKNIQIPRLHFCGF